MLTSTGDGGPDGFCRDVALPGLEAMSDDQAYRAMDLLVAPDTHAEVQEAVFFAVADLLNLEVDLLFFDTTSTGRRWRAGTCRRGVPRRGSSSGRSRADR